MLSGFSRNRKGMAMPLILIFVAAFAVLALGILAVSTDELRLVSNFEHSVRAFYLAEGAMHEAAAGYLQTGNMGGFTYNTGIAGSEAAAVIQVTQEQGVNIIRATGRSGGVTRHVAIQIRIKDGVPIVGHWRDYGLAD